MSSEGFVFLDWNELSQQEMMDKASQLFQEMNSRRTTRHFSSRDVPKCLIERAIMCGSTAPSGAHLQPWTFVAVSNQELQETMREAAAIEERKT